MIKTLRRKKQSVKSESIRLILLHGQSTMFVQFWFKFVNKKHFKDQTVQFALTFLHNLEISFDGLGLLSVLVFYVIACVPPHVHESVGL